MSSKPEKGGPATQAGIYFQNCITVLRLAEMLCQGQLPPSSSGRITSVRTEAPEEVDDTVVTWSSGRKEYIQAKLSISPKSEAWNILWNHFYQQYQSPDFNRTPNGDAITLAVNWTPQMLDLENALTRARTADSAQEWIERSTASHQKFLKSIKTVLGIDDEILFQLCRFVRVWISPFESDPEKTDTFERQVCGKLDGVVEPTTSVFSLLVDLVGRTARVRGTWRYDDLVDYLEQKKLRVLASVTPPPPPEFQPLQPNPYQFGPPLKSATDLFVGREELMDAILWRVRKHAQDRMAPNTVLLYGPHRSGKSSILFQLRHKVGSGFRPVYVDLNYISLAERSSDVLEAIATEMATSLLLDGIHVGVPSHDQFVNQPVPSMTTFIRRIVTACAPQKPILMLDESDALSGFADDQKTTLKLLTFLRSLVVHNRDVFFIFASCRDIRWLADPGMSRLLTLADEYLRVDLLSQPEACALILDPVREHFTYTPEALIHVIALSGCHPCFVQLICHQVVEWRNRERVNRVSRQALLDGVVPGAVARGHEQFADLWGGLTPDERGILFALSYILEDKSTATPEEVETQLATLQLHVADWDIALDRVMHTGLVDLQEGHLRMQLGLLKHWIYRTPMNTLFPQRSIDRIMGGVN